MAICFHLIDTWTRLQAETLEIAGLCQFRKERKFRSRLSTTSTAFLAQACFAFLYRAIIFHSDKLFFTAAAAIERKHLQQWLVVGFLLLVSSVVSIWLNRFLFRRNIFANIFKMSGILFDFCRSRNLLCLFKFCEMSHEEIPVAESLLAITSPAATKRIEALSSTSIERRYAIVCIWDLTEQLVVVDCSFLLPGVLLCRHGLGRSSMAVKSFAGQTSLKTI